MIRFLLLATLLLVHACSAPRALDRYVQPVAVGDARPSPATIAAIAKARGRIGEARRLSPGFDGSDALMKQAQDAALEGNNPRAQSLALEAQGRAELALDGYYVAASAQELQRLYALTGLNDSQLDRLREAEVALVRGEGARAHGLLKALGKDLREKKQHRVRPGESLSTISARPEIYSNALLWPLIWEANRDRIPDPNVLHEGQTLRIRPNPTVDEVVRAVETARSRMGAQVRIGKIREEKK